MPGGSGVGRGEAIILLMQESRCAMKQVREFLQLKAPRSGLETPRYFRRALSTNQIALAVYFLLTFALFSLNNHRLEWVPLAMFGWTVLCRLSIGRVNSRVSLYAFELMIVVWCAWHTHTVGWNYGAQHLLIPMLMLCFFNIYEPAWVKVFTFLMVLAYRTSLFSYSLDHPGTYEFSQTMTIVYQTMNTLTLFNMLAINFIVFSSSIQESERELLLNNQELYREAGTDPLTQLPNRRAMLDEIMRYKKENPEESFGVAIADIDFFKKVNDTYGHNCGDYTLKELSALFMRLAEEKYRVCRWGGEEFCFFLPGMNIDDARREMQDLCIAVRRQRLHYGDIEYSVTITIGVEENDYHSTMEQILDRADRKLYMGKVGGRNRVVV